jgi:hypothetical protein
MDVAIVLLKLDHAEMTTGAQRQGPVEGSEESGQFVQEEYFTTRPSPTPSMWGGGWCTVFAK